MCREKEKNHFVGVLCVLKIIINPFNTKATVSEDKMLKKSFWENEKGFALIDLMLVISLIGIMVSIACLLNLEDILRMW